VGQVSKFSWRTLYSQSIFQVLLSFFSVSSQFLLKFCSTFSYYPEPALSKQTLATIAYSQSIFQVLLSFLSSLVQLFLAIPIQLSLSRLWPQKHIHRAYSKFYSLSYQVLFNFFLPFHSNPSISLKADSGHNSIFTEHIPVFSSQFLSSFVQLFFAIPIQLSLSRLWPQKHIHKHIPVFSQFLIKICSTFSCYCGQSLLRDSWFAVARKS
jgi:hypothetical protein